MSDIEKFLTKINPLFHLSRLIDIIELDLKGKMTFLELLFAKLTYKEEEIAFEGEDNLTETTDEVESVTNEQTSSEDNSTIITEKLDIEVLQW